MKEEINQENQDRQVSYQRLSLEDPKNPSLSISKQKETCENYAKEQGDKISENYQDIKSGTTLNRPGFKKMMEDAEKRLFNKIFIKTWDRFSRDQIDLELTIRKLNTLNVLVISCAGDNDPQLRILKGALAQIELMNMRIKSNITHQTLIKKGEATMPCPFGYCYPIDTKRYLRTGEKNPKYDSNASKTFVEDGKNAEALKDIFKMRINNIKIKEIAEKHKKTIMGIHWILKNKVYLGFLKYRGSLYKGHHVPLIEKSVFEKAQQINKENRRNVKPKIL